METSLFPNSELCLAAWFLIQLCRTQHSLALANNNYTPFPAGRSFFLLAEPFHLPMHWICKDYGLSNNRKKWSSEALFINTIPEDVKTKLGWLPTRKIIQEVTLYVRDSPSGLNTPILSSPSKPFSFSNPNKPGFPGIAPFLCCVHGDISISEFTKEDFF